MNHFIKLSNIKISNLKNVAFGEISIPISFENYGDSNILGIYGQNGSGKTTVIEAMAILKNLISGRNEEDSPLITDDSLIYFDKESTKIEYEFLSKNSFGEYFIKYSFEFMRNQENYYLHAEELSYKENIPRKKYKTLISKKADTILIKNKNLKSLPEETRIRLKVIDELANKESTSFIFSKGLLEYTSSIFEETENEIIKNIYFDFNKNLLIINNEKIGLIMSKLVMPFSVHRDKSRGFIPYDLDAPAVLPIHAFELLSKIITQTNIVLNTIIPGLIIDIQIITKQLSDSGEEAVRFEFISHRGDKKLPLRTESEGVLKIIAILNALIAAFNNPNACIVIDELDSGIFEYLLGELLVVLEEGGKGQLIFTSHNLRILEVLPYKNLWFTTVDENNRYIQLKGIKKVNNLRDVYIKTIQIGGQEAELYDKTKTFHIKKAFRKAGHALD